MERNPESLTLPKLKKTWWAKTILAGWKKFPDWPTFSLLVPENPHVSLISLTGKIVKFFPDFPDWWEPCISAMYRSSFNIHWSFYMYNIKLFLSICIMDIIHIHINIYTSYLWLSKIIYNCFVFNRFNPEEPDHSGDSNSAVSCKQSVLLTYCNCCVCIIMIY